MHWKGEKQVPSICMEENFVIGSVDQCFPAELPKYLNTLIRYRTIVVAMTVFGIQAVHL